MDGWQEDEKEGRGRMEGRASLEEDEAKRRMRRGSFFARSFDCARRRESYSVNEKKEQCSNNTVLLQSFPGSFP